MASPVIGRLIADFVSRTDKFTPGAKRVDRHLVGIRKSLKKTQKGMAAMNAAFAAMGAAMAGINIGKKLLNTAGDFEASMKRVEAISGATGDALGALSDKARLLGRTTQFTASDAADSMETLVKNGLSVQAIMGGALDASLTLAAATGAELARAADVATDVMLNFGKEASELADIVDGITGVTLTSKFGFEDYALALNTAGGSTGNFGVELEDFNTIIAATASKFASGRTAGTAFKTFVSRLPGPTKTASDEIKRLGLEFFDSAGKVKSMAEISQELSEVFEGLTDKQRILSATTIFGLEAMNTATALAELGAEGYEKLAAAIAKVDAAAQAAKRLEGWNGMLLKMTSAIEGVILTLGFEGGFLGIMTEVGEKITGWIGILGEINPEILKWGVMIAGAGTALTVLLAGLGAVTAAVTAFAIPVGILLLKVALITAAVAAAVAVVVALGVGLKTVGDFIIPPLAAAFSALAADFKLIFGGMLDAAIFVGNGIQSAFESAIKAAATALNFLIDAYNKLPWAQQLGMGFSRINVEDLGFENVTAGLKEAFSNISVGVPEFIKADVQGFTDQYKKNFGAVVDGVTDTAKEAGDKIKELLFKKPAEDGAVEFADGVNRVKEVVADVVVATDAASNKMAEFGKSLNDSLTDGIVNGEKLGDVLNNVARQMGGDAIRNLLQGKVNSDTGVRAGGILGGLGKVFGGFFAKGGNLGAGQWGIAGEEGPEIIHGPASVTPMGGGGMTVHMTQQFSAPAGGDPRDLAEMVRNANMEFFAELKRRQYI